MVANLGQPINSSISIGGGGNPYAGLAGGGLAGLAQSYGQDYNAYINTNTSLYNAINQGYGTVQKNIADTLGQGGSDWGVAQPAANQIVMAGNRAAGGAIQNSINSGVGKSTAAVAAQRGVTADTDQALGALGSSLANTYAGYESNLGQSQLNFMNSVTAPPPNAGAYNQLFQQYGQQQAGQQSMAMQQQALAAQTRAAGYAHGGAAGRSGGGGVSIPNAPRGGTFGSGSGGFPSGGGVDPTTGGGGGAGLGPGPGGQANLVPGSAGFVGPPNLGGTGMMGNGSIDPYTGIGSGAGGYDPWATNTGTASGDPTAVNFANGQFGDMSGQFGFSAYA
jgi:hypothetical protein